MMPSTPHRGGRSVGLSSTIERVHQMRNDHNKHWGAVALYALILTSTITADPSRRLSPWPAEPRVPPAASFPAFPKFRPDSDLTSANPSVHIIWTCEQYFARTCPMTAADRQACSAPMPSASSPAAGYPTGI